MKCIVGMSGGVDSSTTVALMKQKYDEVIGCTFKMFDSPKTEAAIEDAKKVADFLKIKHIVVDCRNDFKKCVMDNFVESYKKGETPNPCVLCNNFVKFKYLNAVREENLADMMATGHYARIVRNQNQAELHQASDLTKDQSYFLYKLNQSVLRFIEFPLGEFTKVQTRQIAREIGIHVAEKSESQDVCFIPDNDYISFVKKNSGESFPGNIVDESENILGRHHGTINYTIGQRKGLGLSGGPFFVKEIRSGSNEVVVTNKIGVRINLLKLAEVNFINGEYLGPCEVKIRSTGRKISAGVRKSNDEYIVDIISEEYGAAKGQHCVFYSQDKVIGGGIIVGAE